MKTFRLIGMALLAVVMGLNFIACSDDDEEEPTKNDDGVITNQKQLMQIKMVDDDGESVVTEYTYDSNGKLVSATHTEQYDGNKHGSSDKCVVFLMHC